MTRWDVNDVRCAALFASGLQRSEVPDSEAVTEAVRRTVGRRRPGLCRGDGPGVRRSPRVGAGPDAVDQAAGRPGTGPPGIRRHRVRGLTAQRVRALSAACPYSSAARQQYQASTER